MNKKSVGIIPARYQSTRFPGKPLSLINGISLLQRTYIQATQAKLLSEVYVATDDSRIFDHVLSFGGKALMTSSNCLTGTDRVAEGAKQMMDADFIVNIQGDEPCIDPISIDKSIQALIDYPDRVASTLAAPLEPEDYDSHSVVKCVFALDGKALYFSRSLIPGSKGEKIGPYFRHIGLYAFRRDFLINFMLLKPTPLMLSEDLEQLKILEHGYNLHITPVEKGSPGVDEPADIKKVEKFLCQ